MHIEPKRNRFQLPPWLWAPCALYVISAACILIGIAQIIVPIYQDADLSLRRAMEKFQCLVALNVYEIALLAVALTILLLRRVYDDAVALTLLISLFLVASAIGLDTVAPQFAMPAMLFGLAGLLMAAAKLFALNRFIVGAMPVAMTIGLVILLLWNFLMPGLMGMLFKRIMDDPLAGDTAWMTQAWLAGWWVTLVGGAVLVGAVMAVRSGDINVGTAGRPFLQTATMRWIVAAIILAATCVHQFALTWAFGVRGIGISEMLPALGLCTLVVLEVIRGHGCRFNVLDGAIVLLPMGAAIPIVLGETYEMTLGSGLGAVSSPGVFLALFGASLAVSGWLHARAAMHGMAAAYALAAALVLRVDPWLEHRQGWLFIALSFVILAMGAAASLLKGRYAGDDDDQPAARDRSAAEPVVMKGVNAE